MKGLGLDILLHIFERFPISFEDFLSYRATCSDFCHALSVSTNLKIVIKNGEHDTSDLQQKCIRRLNPKAQIILLNVSVPDKTTLFFCPSWALDKSVKVNFVIEKHGSSGINLDPKIVSFLRKFLDSSPRHQVTFRDEDPVLVGIIPYGDPPQHYEDFRELCEELKIKPSVLRYMRLGPAMYLPTFPGEDFTQKITIPHVHTVVFSSGFSKYEVSDIIRSNRHPDLPNVEKVVILQRRCNMFWSMDPFSDEITSWLSTNGQKWKETMEEKYHEWIRLQ